MFFQEVSNNDAKVNENTSIITKKVVCEESESHFVSQKRKRSQKSNEIGSLKKTDISTTSSKKSLSTFNDENANISVHPRVISELNNDTKSIETETQEGINDSFKLFTKR